MHLKRKKVLYNAYINNYYYASIPLKYLANESRMFSLILNINFKKFYMILKLKMNIILFNEELFLNINKNNFFKDIFIHI